MFTRTKKDYRNGHIYVQIVESYREQGRIKQRVIRHIGTAKSEEELKHLKQVASTVKIEIERSLLKKKITPVENYYLRSLDEMKPITKQEKLSLIDTQVCQSYVSGIHDLYGFVYDIIGFTDLLPLSHQRNDAVDILREIVLARIAQPASKRASVEILNEQFGVKLDLDNVYQMMDKINNTVCESIQKKALTAALNLTNEKLKVLFYDATTLYFESFTEDSLKQNGYSKDMKFNQPQVLLALFVTEKGLPVGYEVFSGATFEGHTLIPVLEKLKARYNIEEVVFVADRGMLSKENIEYLDKNNFYYIVGARIKSVKKTQQEVILGWANGLEKGRENTCRIDTQDSQYLILSYSVSRAKKDKADREKAIQKLQTRLKRSKNPKQLISRYGFQKFISVKGEATLHIDAAKLKEEAQWDGVTGVLTNHPELQNAEVLKHYRGLWQVEESFRISKHDLRIRPVYHWTPKRIKAHIAIAFMAFTCVRYLEYRVSTQYKKISPEQIRKSLMQVQVVVIKNAKQNKEYLFPLPINNETKQIYRILGLKTLQGIMRVKTKQA